MDDIGEYLDDEGYYEEEGEEMEPTDWQRYQSEMFARQKYLEALTNAKRMSVDDLTQRCIFPMIFGEPCLRLAELIGFCLIVNFTSCLRKLF